MLNLLVFYLTVLCAKTAAGTSVIHMRGEEGQLTFYDNAHLI